MPDHVRKIALHDVRSRAVAALAAAQLHHGAQLSESLALDFIEECNSEDFNELVEEFAPCANAMAQVSSSADIICRIFDDEDWFSFFIFNRCKNSFESINNTALEVVLSHFVFCRSLSSPFL